MTAAVVLPNVQDTRPGVCEDFAAYGLAFLGRDFVRDLPLRALAVAPDVFLTLPNPDRAEKEKETEEEEVRESRPDLQLGGPGEI